jgi:hypothetical protein
VIVGLALLPLCQGTTLRNLPWHLRTASSGSHAGRPAQAKADAAGDIEWLVSSCAAASASSQAVTTALRGRGVRPGRRRHLARPRSGRAPRALRRPGRTRGRHRPPTAVRSRARRAAVRARSPGPAAAPGELALAARLATAEPEATADLAALLTGATEPAEEVGRRTTRGKAGRNRVTSSIALGASCELADAVPSRARHELFRVADRLLNNPAGAGVVAAGHQSAGSDPNAPGRLSSGGAETPVVLLPTAEGQ